MNSHPYAVGALISLGITVFTIISTIYPAIITQDGSNNNNNINREIIKLRNNFSLKYSDVPFNNFDDYQRISNKILSTNKNQNLSKFMSILAYREGKILDKKVEEGKPLENDSMESYLKNYMNEDTIEPTDSIWYPLRQIKLEKLVCENSYLDSSIYCTKSSLNSTSKIQAVNKLTKEEDFFCNELKNNSIIDDEMNKNTMVETEKIIIPNDTTYCSNNEIKQIINYSNEYSYIINIMNENSDNKLSNLTHEFKQLTNYFKWFIVFAFITGPIVFFAWKRNYIE